MEYLNFNLWLENTDFSQMLWTFNSVFFLKPVKIYDYNLSFFLLRQITFESYLNRHCLRVHILNYCKHLSFIMSFRDRLTFKQAFTIKQIH